MKIQKKWSLMPENNELIHIFWNSEGLSQKRGVSDNQFLYFTDVYSHKKNILGRVWTKPRCYFYHIIQADVNDLFTEYINE